MHEIFGFPAQTRGHQQSPRPWQYEFAQSVGVMIVSIADKSAGEGDVKIRAPMMQIVSAQKSVLGYWQYSGRCNQMKKSEDYIHNRNYTNKYKQQKLPWLWHVCSLCGQFYPPTLKKPMGYRPPTTLEHDCCAINHSCGHPPGGEIPFPLPTRTRKDAWGVGTPPIPHMKRV